MKIFHRVPTRIVSPLTVFCPTCQHWRGGDKLIASAKVEYYNAGPDFPLPPTRQLICKKCGTGLGFIRDMVVKEIGMSIDTAGFTEKKAREIRWGELPRHSTHIHTDDPKKNYYQDEEGEWQYKSSKKKF